MMFRALIAQLLVALLTLHLVSSAAQVTNPPVGSPVESPLSPTIDCAGACEVRCGLSSRPEECKRACGTCCARCGCVPPGTSGHYEVCPCYRNMTTHGGRHKCP